MKLRSHYGVRKSPRHSGNVLSTHKNKLRRRPMAVRARLFHRTNVSKPIWHVAGHWSSCVPRFHRVRIVWKAIYYTIITIFEMAIIETNRLPYLRKPRTTFKVVCPSFRLSCYFGFIHAFGVHAVVVVSGHRFMILNPAARVRILNGGQYTMRLRSLHMA